MGIGRREFFKLTSLALAGLAVDPLQAVVTNKDIYINKKLGILFYKPNGWRFIQVTDFGKLKEQQILGNGYEYIKEEIWDDLGDPICIATKYPQDLPIYKGLFSPTITLNIDHKSEFEDIDYDGFEELMRLSALGAAEILTDFKILKKHPPYKISGCHFYEYDAQYLFEHEDLDQPLLTELKVLRAEHNDYYYYFNCHQSKAAHQIAEREFEQFKSSIKLI